MSAGFRDSTPYAKKFCTQNKLDMRTEAEMQWPVLLSKSYKNNNKTLFFIFLKSYSGRFVYSR